MAALQSGMSHGKRSMDMENPSFRNGDILFDVLSCLPVKTLLETRCVSKEWHKLISGRVFIQAQLQKTELTLSGFIYQEKYQFCSVDIKTFSYIPMNSDSKVRDTVFDFLPEEVVVLSSCNGLVCCRSCISTKNPAIYVCNPLFKQWVCFEVAHLDRYDNIALVFDPSRDPINKSSNFKIVRIQKFEDDQKGGYYTFEIYSSETRAWRKSNEICYSDSQLAKNKGIYAKGILHWLTDTNQILIFDMEKELSLLISTPIPVLDFYINVPETCIGESGGLLNFIRTSEEGIIIWYLEDYFETKWTLRHSKQLQAIEEENPKMFCSLYKRMNQKLWEGMNPAMDPLAFKDGVLLMRVYTKIYFYHIDTGKMVEACSRTSYINPTVLPYSMTLVPLTASFSQSDSEDREPPERTSKLRKLGV